MARNTKGRIFQSPTNNTRARTRFAKSTLNTSSVVKPMKFGRK